MTPAERLADRIAKNRVIDARAAGTVRSAKSARSSEIESRQNAVRKALDKFEQIKATQGLDAAVESVRNRKP
jgi:hypothetical protein